jgi:uncharacterized membrane protein YhaH (DUF805 family)
MSFEVGRIGRAHYWGLVVLLLIGRFLVSKVVGPLPIFFGWLALVYLLLSARFHDFGAPSWLVGSLMALVYGAGVVAGLYLAATAGPAVGIKTVQELAQHVSPTVLVLLVVPEWLMFLLAGTIPGHVGRNPYGPPGQGFAGIIPHAADRPVEVGAALASDRLEGVLARRSSHGDNAPRVLPRRVSSRGASASFGRR